MTEAQAKKLKGIREWLARDNSKDMFGNQAAVTAQFLLDLYDEELENNAELQRRTP